MVMQIAHNNETWLIYMRQFVFQDENEMCLWNTNATETAIFLEM